MKMNFLMMQSTDLKMDSLGAVCNLSWAYWSSIDSIHMCGSREFMNRNLKFGCGFLVDEISSGSEVDQCWKNEHGLRKPYLYCKTTGYRN